MREGCGVHLPDILHESSFFDSAANAGNENADDREHGRHRENTEGILHVDGLAYAETYGENDGHGDFARGGASRVPCDAGEGFIRHNLAAEPETQHTHTHKHTCYSRCSP